MLVQVRGVQRCGLEDNFGLVGSLGIVLLDGFFAVFKYRSHIAEL